MTRATADDAPTLSRALPWAVILFGLAPRIVEFVHYRTLWADEAWYGANMVTMSVRELFGPLRYGGNVAPPAYLVLSKALIAIFGVNEYAARLLPFLGGVAVLLLFYPVARRLTSPITALIGLAIVASSQHLIHYASEVRQYSTDAAVTLLILWLVLRLEANPDSRRWTIGAAVLAAALPWLSMTAVFVLAAAAVAQALSLNAQNRTHWLVVNGAWVISFLLLYCVNIVPVTHSPNMANMDGQFSGAGAFLPLLPRRVDDLKWLLDAFFQMFDNPGGLTATELAGCLFVLGSIALLLSDWRRLVLLLGPIVLTVVASNLHHYPFYKRTILFLAPLILLITAHGVAYLFTDTRRRWPIAGMVALAMLVAHPAARAARIVVQPSAHHELNRALEYAQAHWRPGDVLCVPNLESLSFRFCNWRYGFQPDQYVLLSDAPKGGGGAALWKQEIDALRGRARVWVPTLYDLPELAKPTLDRFDAAGARLDTHHDRGASIYLYDLRPPSQAPAVP